MLARYLQGNDKHKLTYRGYSFFRGTAKYQNAIATEISCVLSGIQDS